MPAPSSSPLFWGIFATRQANRQLSTGFVFKRAGQRASRRAIRTVSQPAAGAYCANDRSHTYCVDHVPIWKCHCVAVGCYASALRDEARTVKGYRDGNGALSSLARAIGVPKRRALESEREGQLNIMPATSIAANGTGGEFYWRCCATSDHVEAAVDKLMEIIVEGRLNNIYWARQTRTQFKRRIEAAKRGELVPTDQVKPVGDRIPEVLMFEIRWVKIPVNERDPDFPGKARENRVDVRLYFAEPPGHGAVMLGLHCHEKVVTGDAEEIQAAQDSEIAHAFTLYSKGFAEAWGVEALKR